MSDVLGGVAATFSKSPKMWSGDPEWQPREVVAGQGARVLGIDNRWYLEWTSALGAVGLGYPSGKIDGRFTTMADCWAGRVSEQIYEGAGFGLPHIREAYVAEQLTHKLTGRIPGWQNQPLGVRWLKTGSDACMAAVRLARAVTGREYILSVGYHGWHDTFVATTPPAHGVVGVQCIWSVNYGDLTSLDKCFDDLGDEPAAVIIEQPPQPIPDGYWQAVQRLCREHGALLIVDEVVTGLRYAMGGACERFGIEPDIVCMGKALGNGLPIAAIVGRWEYWEWFARTDPVFVSSTSFGDAVSLAAADAVLDLWDQAAVGHIWQIGQALMDGLRDAGYEVTGYPPVCIVNHPTPSHRAFFIRSMAQQSILANRPFVPNLSHSLDDVRQTVDAARQIKALMASVDVEREMIGKLPQVLFERR